MITKSFNLRVIYDNDLGPIRGFTLTDDNGDPVIAINDGMDHQEQIVTIMHELVHVVRGDLTRENTTADDLESECHADLVRAALQILKEHHQGKRE